MAVKLIYNTLSLILTTYLRQNLTHMIEIDLTAIVLFLYNPGNKQTICTNKKYIH